MNKQITITSLVGTEPYNVYLCDNTYNNCIYIDTINDVDIPYTFLVPESFQNLATVGVKLLDGRDCIINDTVAI